ncbi:MAG: hypothetical protein SOT06_05030 [Eubacteriales bacterium]|nr:hypothetical protein [Eubacteriales bacterium]
MGTAFAGTAFAGTAFTGTAFMGTAFTGTAFTLIACILLFYHYIMDLSTVKCRIGAKFLAFIPQNHPKIQKSCRLDPIYGYAKQQKSLRNSEYGLSYGKDQLHSL